MTKLTVFEEMWGRCSVSVCGGVGGVLDLNVESCHIIFSQNTYMNFKVLLIINLETFQVINPVKLIKRNNSPPNVPNEKHFPKLD